MSRRDPMVYVYHMQDYAIAARDISQDYSRPDLDTNKMLNLALQKTLQVISTATSRIPDDFKHSRQKVGWDEAESFFGKAIKSYDDVNLDTLWDIIQNDIPPLIEQLDDLISKEALIEDWKPG